MRCEEIQDRLPEYVSGSLQEDERQRIAAHLQSGCTRCIAEHEAMGQAIALLAESLPATAPRPELRDKLLGALDRELVTPNSLASTANAAERSWTAYLPYVAVTLCAAVVGAVVSEYIGNDSGTLPETVAGARDPMTDEAGAAQWRRRVAAAEREFGPPRAQLAGMSATSADPALQVVVFYDPLVMQMHVLVAGVGVSDPQRTLWAWFQDEADQVMFGGPLKSLGAVQATGVIDANADDDPSRIRSVLLTDESTGAHDAPAGPELGRAQIAPSP